MERDELNRRLEEIRLNARAELTRVYEQYEMDKSDELYMSMSDARFFRSDAMDELDARLTVLEKQLELYY